MTVPRTRQEFFQDDIFTLTRSLKPTFSSDEWLSGATRDPPLESLRPEGMPLLSEAPAGMFVPLSLPFTLPFPSSPPPFNFYH
jgi:hypothetical protein